MLANSTARVLFSSVSVNESVYYFNPCKTFNLPTNGDPYTVKGEQCHNVLGCQQIQRVKDVHEYYTVGIRLNSSVVAKVTPLIIRYFGSKYECFSSSEESQGAVVFAKVVRQSNHVRPIRV